MPKNIAIPQQHQYPVQPPRPYINYQSQGAFPKNLQPQQMPPTRPPRNLESMEVDPSVRTRNVDYVNHPQYSRAPEKRQSYTKNQVSQKIQLNFHINNQTGLDEHHEGPDLENQEMTWDEYQSLMDSTNSEGSHTLQEYMEEGSALLALETFFGNRVFSDPETESSQT